LTWLDGLTLETIVVHTKDGLSFKGLKAYVHDDGIGLREAVLLEDTGVVDLNDPPFIPRENVSFVQLVTP
jgi:hypothetical protein